MAKKLKLDSIARVQFVKVYTVERVITLKEFVALGWHQAHTLYLYDPKDEQVYRGADLWDWAYDNKGSKSATKFLVVHFLPPEEVNLIKKEESK